jgi:hypothetical protein
MNIESILNSNLDISSIDDEQGRRYYNLNISFSDNDKLTIYKTNIEELIKELPDIISSAIQARIMNKNIRITS